MIIYVLPRYFYSLFAICIELIYLLPRYCYYFFAVAATHPDWRGVFSFWSRVKHVIALPAVASVNARDQEADTRDRNPGTTKETTDAS